MCAQAACARVAHARPRRPVLFIHHPQLAHNSAPSNVCPVVVAPLGAPPRRPGLPCRGDANIAGAAAGGGAPRPVE